jgi:hypothetical protein
MKNHPSDGKYLGAAKRIFSHLAEIAFSTRSGMENLMLI